MKPLSGPARWLPLQKYTYGAFEWPPPRSKSPHGPPGRRGFLSAGLWQPDDRQGTIRKPLQAGGEGPQPSEHQGAGEQADQRSCSDIPWIVIPDIDPGVAHEGREGEGDGPEPVMETDQYQTDGEGSGGVVAGEGGIFAVAEEQVDGTGMDGEGSRPSPEVADDLVGQQRAGRRHDGHDGSQAVLPAVA